MSIFVKVGKVLVEFLNVNEIVIKLFLFVGIYDRFFYYGVVVEIFGLEFLFVGDMFGFRDII